MAKKSTKKIPARKGRPSHQPDFLLLAIITTFVFGGLVVLFSASASYSQERFDGIYYFVKRQIMLGIIPGLIGGMLLYIVPLSLLRKVSAFIFVLTLLLTILVFFPLIGVAVGGASRWVEFWAIRFQPSEFLKLGYILYVAALLSKFVESSAGLSTSGTKAAAFKLKKHAGKVKSKLRRELKGAFSPFLVISMVVALVLIFQPDAGTLGLMLVVGAVMYFVAGASIAHIMSLGVILGGLGTMIAYTTSYRLDRLTVFLDSGTDPLGIGYQINQILIAIGSGGFTGVGLGMSQQKFGFIPQPIGDSIFAVLAEEFGFIGTTLVVTLFMALIFKGLLIARNAPDMFSRLCCIGIISWIGMQAFINMGAMTGLIPLTGIPLPFISYGGSSMMAVLAGMGIVLNISKHTG